jgi:uncharacterized protein DUF4340
MRSMRSLLILVALLGGLVGYIYFVDAKKPLASEAEKKPRVFSSVEADKIEELQVKTAAGQAHLKKGTAGWDLVSPEAMKADENEASGIASSVASLEEQRTIEDNASDLKQYGLAEPRIDVAFKKSGDAAFTHLQLGDKTPTGGDMYAKTSAGNKVFLIPSYLESTFNRTPFDLREKTALKFDRDKVDSLTITNATGEIQLARSGSTWSLAKPVAAKGEYAAIEGLLGRLQSAQMKSIASKAIVDPKAYGLDKPEATAIIGTGSSRATLIIGKATPENNGTVYAKDAVRPDVFTLEAALADELKKPATEYRRKDIFDFRSFNASRIEITRDNVTVAFEKVKGDGKDTQDKWRQVAPAARDVDQAKVDALLTKLSGLRAQSFPDAKTKTGLDKPALTVVAKYDEGKNEERLTFGKSGADVFAARKDEPGAAKLDSNEFDEVIKALDALK